MTRSRQVLLTDDLGFLLSRAGALVAADVNRALTPLDLKVRPYSVLVLACESEDGVNQRGVAIALGLDPSQIVSLVDDLEQRGLVERMPDSIDRRNKRIVATIAGRNLLADAQSRVDAVHARLFGSFPDGVIDELKGALRMMIDG